MTKVLRHRPHVRTTVRTLKAIASHKIKAERESKWKTKRQWRQIELIPQSFISSTSRIRKFRELLKPDWKTWTYKVSSSANSRSWPCLYFAYCERGARPFGQYGETHWYSPWFRLACFYADDSGVLWYAANTAAVVEGKAVKQVIE